MAAGEKSEEGEANWNVERLVDGWLEPYAEYLLENDLIEARRFDTKTELPSKLKKKKRKNNAIQKAEDRMKSESETYFLGILNDEVVGQAVNMYEEGATELRIRIDDEGQRGKKFGGRSLYDEFNQARFEEVEGIPYIVGTHERARYKMENFEWGGEEFVPLALECSSQTGREEGVLMALTGDYDMQPPENIHVPTSLNSFVGDVITTFYSEPPTVNTTSSGEMSYQKSGHGKYVVDMGDEDPVLVAQEIEDEYGGEKEALIDATAPGAIEAARNLEGQGWFYSGFTPDIGERYEGNTIHMRYVDSSRDFGLTEGVVEFFDALNIPYSSFTDTDFGNRSYKDPFESSKSVPGEVG